MKLIFSLLLLTLTYLSYSNEFKDDLFKLNLQIDETLWELKETEKFRERLILKHKSLPATINVIAYRFNETITANGLVQRRIQSIYDGWQLINVQELTKLQSRQKNITEGIRSIYRKTFLDESLKEQQLFAGDICLVTDDTLAIILNITMAHSSTLLRVKDDFNQLYSSFWFGDEKPMVNFVVSKQDQWVKDNQNLSRKRFHESNFKINDSTNLTHELPIKKDTNFKNARYYSNENGQYILSNKTLYVINTFKNDIQTLNLDMNQPQIQLVPDGFYAIQLSPFFKIKRYNLDLKVIEEGEDNQRAIDAFVLNNHFVIINSKEIKLMTPSSRTIWSFDYNFKNIEIVANLEQLIIMDKNQNQLLFFDLNTGKPLDQINLNEISKDLTGRLMDLAINQDKLLISMMDGDTVVQSIINIETKALEDQLIMTELADFRYIAISNNLIILEYKNKWGEIFIEALDFNTFASAWKRPFNGYSKPTVSQHSLFYIKEKDQDLISLELSSAESTSTLNISQLIVTEEYENNEDQDHADIIKVMPLKSKLMALIRVKNKPRVVYLR